MSKSTIMKIVLGCFLFFSPYLCIAEDASQLQTAIDQYLENDIGSSRPVFTKFANQNNPEAHYYLGLIFSNEQSELFKPKWAMSHFESAAEQNHALSMFQIGMMYDNGMGVKQDAMLAVDWYRKSKRAEKPTSAKITFYKEKNNNLKEVEYSEIFQDLLNKAESGDVAVQFQVATIYDHGQLVPHNFAKALKWYKKAAQNNYEEAQFMMGYFYCRGVGMKQDRNVANNWLTKSRRMAKCTE